MTFLRHSDNLDASAVFVSCGKIQQRVGTLECYHHCWFIQHPNIPPFLFVLFPGPGLILLSFLSKNLMYVLYVECWIHSLGWWWCDERNLRLLYSQFSFCKTELPRLYLYINTRGFEDNFGTMESTYPAMMPVSFAKEAMA